MLWSPKTGSSILQSPSIRVLGLVGGETYESSPIRIYAFSTAEKPHMFRHMVCGCGETQEGEEKEAECPFQLRLQLRIFKANAIV